MRAIGLPSDREGDHRCQLAILAPMQRHSAAERDTRRAWRGDGWSPVTSLARSSLTTALGEADGATLSDAGAVPAGSTAARGSRFSGDAGSAPSLVFGATRRVYA